MAEADGSVPGVATAAARDFLARRIVLAIPFSTLRLVRIDTPFSRRKWRRSEASPIMRSNTVPVPDAHPLLAAEASPERRARMVRRTFGTPVSACRAHADPRQYPATPRSRRASKAMSEMQRAAFGTGLTKLHFHN